MNILLVIPPNFSIKMLKEEIDNLKKGTCDFTKSVDWSIAFPIGSLYIASLLKQYDFNVEIIDIHRKFSLCRENGYFLKEEKDLFTFFEDHFSTFLNDKSIDFVGISCLFNVISTTVDTIASIIKQVHSKTKIVAGGHFPTNMYKEIMPKEHFDYIILGEAEEQMLWFAKNFYNPSLNSLIRDNPHIVDLNSYELDTKRPAMIENLDSLPAPNLNLLPYANDYIINSIDSERVGSNLDKKRLKSISIFTSRGCPMKCSFCAAHKVHGRKIRDHSVDYMINYIDSLIIKYDINNLLIQDDMFNYSKKRTLHFCNKFHSKFGERFNIEFPNGLAVWNIDEEVILSLKKIGLKSVTIAVESGSKYVQKEILKKNLNLNLVKEKVNLLKKYNIGVRAFYVIGFIGETINMMEETISFALDLNIDWSEIKIFTPLAGSEMYYIAKKNRILVEDTSEHVFGRCAISTPEFTSEMVKNIQYDGNIRVNFLNNKFLKDKRYDEAEQTFKGLIKKFPNHFFAHWGLWTALNAQGKSKLADDELYKLKKLSSIEGNKCLINKYNINI